MKAYATNYHNVSSRESTRKYRFCAVYQIHGAFLSVFLLALW